MRRETKGRRGEDIDKEEKREKREEKNGENPSCSEQRQAATESIFSQKQLTPGSWVAGEIKHRSYIKDTETGILMKINQMDRKEGCHFICSLNVSTGHIFTMWMGMTQVLTPDLDFGF